MKILSAPRVLIYRPDFSGHRYRKPHIIAIGYLLFSIVVATYLWVWMARENKRRDRLQGVNGKEEQEEVSLGSEDRQRLGDREVSYRYVV